MADPFRKRSTRSWWQKLPLPFLLLQGHPTDLSIEEESPRKPLMLLNLQVSMSPHQTTKASSTQTLQDELFLRIALINSARGLYGFLASVSHAREKPKAPKLVSISAAWPLGITCQIEQRGRRRKFILRRRWELRKMGYPYPLTKLQNSLWP